MDEIVRDDGLSLPRPMEYVRAEIQMLAVNMEKRLREKDDVRVVPWELIPIPDLWLEISAQVWKLRSAIEIILPTTSENEIARVKKKCADIANYCMFIHDNVGK